MYVKRLSLVVFITLVLGLSTAFALSLGAAPAALEPGGVVVPLGSRQADLRAAYSEPLAHLYDDGRLHRLAMGDEISGTALVPGPAVMGDLYFPPGEGDYEEEGDHGGRPYTAYSLQGTLPVSRAYALFPGRVAVLRSTVTLPAEMDEGYVVAMWEIAEIRQVFEGYLMNAVPYDVLTENEVAAGLEDYDLLIVPSIRSDARGDVISLLDESGALASIAAFVEAGGTLYAQGTGLYIAQEAGVLPSGTVDAEARITLVTEDLIANRGRLEILQPDSPLAWSWLVDTLYILDAPVLWPDEGGQIEVIAELTNAEDGTYPAVIRYPVQNGTGQVIGVIGHPTDAARRNELPLFMNALLLALSGKADFYGDAIQTWNPDYDPHEFPAYESVPVSATLYVENLWDTPLYQAVVTETVSPGYRVLSETVHPEPHSLYTTAEGSTLLIWTLGDLAPHARVSLQYQAETDPDTLAAGKGTFSTGELHYLELPPDVETIFLPTRGQSRHATHRPFVLTAKMAARLVGDRDIEGDRYFVIPDDGIYLDVALPLENKEETLASSLHMQDWVYLLAPIVDIENQHIILNANDGETIWVKNEPYLWDARKDYPEWEGATSPTQTITLEDWRALPEAERPRCVFTSTYGIHIDPPPMRASTAITDYGSFITIPPTYTDAITVINHELWLPCMPLDWDLGDFPAYWYEEPAVRYGVHSRELFERDVYFHGTPREDAVVMPYDAGSVYVLAGTYPVPYREYLEHAEAYAARATSASELTYMDVWSRTHTLTFRASFYDVWDWDACTTCDISEQHAGFAVTFGIWADLDNDGEHETLVREIPTRLDDAQLQLLGKTYSVNDEDDFTIPAGENLIDLPIFHGLGIKIGPKAATWYDSWRSVGPGTSELFTVTEGVDYDDLYFRQVIPPGSWASFVVSATIENYPFNREGQFKLHDGGRLVYRQQIAGPNRYEVYDAHVHTAEGMRSDGNIQKTGGPIQVSVYSDTLMFTYKIWDKYDARDFGDTYDPFMKSWGYGDLVWTTYVGGREDKTVFSSVLGEGDHAIVRVALDNNTGITLTHLNVELGTIPGITVTHLYTDPETAPEPIWPELTFLNRADVPDAWRSVWYFEIQVGDVTEDLWGKVIEIPVIATADNFPTGKPYDEVPPARIALQRPGDADPVYASGPAHSLVLTDVLPSDVVLNAAAWTTDSTAVVDVQMALDADAGAFTQDTASEVYAGLVPTRATALTYTVDESGLVTFMLPAEVQSIPLETPLYVIAPATLVRAQHGPNVVNAGAGIVYTDPFEMQWTAQSDPVIVEAHGAAVWVDYNCNGGTVPSRRASRGDAGDIYVIDGVCYIPDDGPADVEMEVIAYNNGDAIAKNVTITLNLPEWVSVTAATLEWQALDEGHVTWGLGDLAPGQWKLVNITFHVELLGGGDERRALQATSVMTIRDLLGIEYTHGIFVDGTSEQTVSGKVGGPFWFKVYSLERGALVYLPLVMRDYLTPVTIPVQVGIEIPERDIAYQGEVFYSETLRLPEILPDTGTFYLSSQPDAVAPIMVDDELALVIGNTDVFTYRFSLDGLPPEPPVPAVVEIPSTVMAQLAGQVVTLEYRDVYGAKVEATEIWWIWMP
ncbi:MAG: hypothetical protein JXA33_27140 [Anaerolineae bacterium]|nr:hypothetical protein [Anaerolineae bacterium]